jgi:hypothetical protein
MGNSKLHACKCGCIEFNLIQQKENVKTMCVNCQEINIIYWNGGRREKGANDLSRGKMKRLDTGAWVD